MDFYEKIERFALTTVLIVAPIALIAALYVLLHTIFKHTC